MQIEREAHQIVVADLKQFPAVAILGPRQSGKTTLAKAVTSSRLDTLYLDLERPSHLSRLQDPETFLSLHRDKLVCIDEVQLRPDLFPLLRSLIDEDHRAGRFLILGSSSPELLRQSSETLAGRLSYVYITPFHQKELQRAEKAPTDWRRLLWRGGFPPSYLATTDTRSFRWRESYIQTFVERDLRQFGVDLTPQYMRRLWLMCCHLHGQIVNYSALGQSLDRTHPTLKRHIDILEATFMLRRLPPFAVNMKKRLVKSPKLYVRDSGLLACLLELDGFGKLYGHPVYGACWEGFAIENVLSLLQPRGMYGFFRTRTGEEIDLVVERGGKRIGFEFKTSSSPSLTKGNRAAVDLLGLDRLFVVVPQGSAYPIDTNRIWVTPLDEIENHV
ncbi:MAG: ATP-binding protein [Deltaproteobacteria bacterium]|nr:ATP-binding protein [Deltaproteobacteria bacterium]